MTRSPALPDPPLREDILVDGVEAIFSDMLEVPIVPEDGLEPDSPVITSIVQLVGAWGGSLELRASAEVCASAAGRLMGLDPDDLSPQDIRDAWGELGNLVAGQLLQHVPGPTTLSPPIVARGRSIDIDIPSSFPVACQTFELEGGALVAIFCQHGRVLFETVELAYR